MLDTWSTKKLKISGRRKNNSNFKTCNDSIQEGEIKLKRYDGLNEDVPSVMHISTNSQIDLIVMAIQNQANQEGSQIKYVPKLNWKANFTCQQSDEKGHMARECPHTSTIIVPQVQQAQPSVTIPTGEANIVPLPTTNHTYSQTITAELPVSPDLWQGLMNHLIKANQGNKLLKKVVKIVKLSTVEKGKSKTSPKGTSSTPTRAAIHCAFQQKHSDKIKIQARVQVVIASIKQDSDNGDSTSKGESFNLDC